jgi:hypothetical protein
MNSNKTTELRNAIADWNVENNVTKVLQNSSLLLNSWINNVYVRSGDTLKHLINGEVNKFGFIFWRKP